MGITDTGSAPQGRPATRSLSYVALVLTLILACMHIVAAVRGRAMGWSANALLIALCAVSVTGFVSGKALRQTLVVVGMVFALVAVYGMVR